MDIIVNNPCIEEIKIDKSQEIPFLPSSSRIKSIFYKKTNKNKYTIHIIESLNDSIFITDGILFVIISKLQ